MSTARIVVVGSINADLLLRTARHPLPGETLIGWGGGFSPGGKGANQAVAAARLGGEVAMVGAVGDDSAAEPALQELRAAGVDLQAVRRVPGPTGLAAVTVADDGENSIIVVPGANASVDEAAVEESAARIRDAAVVVLQGEIPRPGIERAARLCEGRLILNPAPVLDLDRDVLLRADPLVVNQHEARLVARQLAAARDEDGAERATDPEGDPHALISVLTAAGIRSVVLTLGADGAVVADGGPASPLIQQVPATEVEVVDTTGAGDAFIGALALSLATGAELVDGARLATRVAGYSVGRLGAQRSYPGLEDPLPPGAGAGTGSR